MKIDAHHHFWQYDPGTYGWITDDMKAIRRDYSPADLEPLLRFHDFDGSVLVQVNHSEEETLHFHEMALKNPFIRGVVGWTDFFSKDLSDTLEKYSLLTKMVGFRHIVQGEPLGFMRNDVFVKGIQRLAEHNFTYDILIYPHQMADALHLVKACPQVQFVLDHLAKPHIKEGKIQPWANYLRELASYPNVACKVSGMVTEAAPTWKKEDFSIYLDFAVATFGADRLLYGSDWPVCLAAGSYEEQLSIVETYFQNFSEAEKAGIFGENAARIYRLKQAN